MSRRDQHPLHVLATLPWPFGLGAAVLVWLAGRVLVPGALAGNANPLLAGIAGQLQRGGLDPLLWALSLACVAAAAVSALTARRRRRLLDQQRNLDTLRALPWRDFEHLLAEAYRRQGWRVEDTGRGADGGIDLIIRRNGESRLVQCKQWRNRRVGAPTVREQFGLLMHHGADGVVIVTASHFTDEARTFAAGKPIELIDGPMLLTLVRSVQSGEPAGGAAVSDSGDSASPIGTSPSARTCPRCGGDMVERVSKKTAERFLGCVAFPRCRGTRARLS